MDVNHDINSLILNVNPNYNTNHINLFNMLCAIPLLLAIYTLFIKYAEMYQGI